MKLSRYGAKLPSLARLCCGVGIAVALAACSSPADKATGYYEKGQALLAQGDLVKARLEFQNALQIKGTLTGPLYGLAEIAERQGDWQRLFGLLNKIVEQDPKHWQAQVKLGRLLVAAGQLDKALKASDAALAAQPEDAGVLALRAAVLYKLDDRAGAVEQANAALARDPDNVDAIVVLATERLAAGDAQRAVQYLDEGLKLNEKSVVLQLVKVQALEKLAKLDSAEEIFRKLIAFYPDNRGLRHVLARFYLGHDQQDKAEAEYRAVVAENPRDVQARLDVVRFVNSVKGAKAAIAELEALIGQDPESNELKFALAGFHQNGNDRVAAEAILRELISKAGDSPDGLKAKGLLAASMLSGGDRPAAAALVSEILAKDQRNEQGLFLKASLALDERKLEQAIADLRTILRDVPNSARTLLYLAKAHELAGSPELAEEHYVRAFQASKLAAPFGMAYAEFLAKRGNVARAEKAVEDLLAVSRGYPPALRMLAQLRISQGDWTGAQEVADEIRKQGGQDKVSEQILGAVYAGKENYEASVSAFKRAYEAAPTEVQPIVALVRTYLRAGKTNEAASFLNSVLVSSPGNNSARLLQGQLQVLKGEKGAAARTFETVIVAEPTNALGYRSLAGLHMGEQRYDDADKVVARGLAALPGDFSLRVTRAAIYEAAGRFDDAIVVYEELLRERPNADVLANNLASLLSEHRTDHASLNRAYELAQRFKRSDIPQFKDTLGWANYRIGKHDEASSLLQGATEQLPNLPVFRYHLGMNYLAQADKEAARRELEKALELAGEAAFPHAEQVRKALDGL